MNFIKKLLGSSHEQPVVPQPAVIDATAEKINELMDRYESGEISLDHRDKKIAVLTIDDETELDRALEDIDLRSDPVAKNIREIHRRHESGEISENQRDKEIATINDEPYVNVLSLDVDPENPARGMMELDFNDHFVSFLGDQGFTGLSDDDIVNKWFNLLCRTIIKQADSDQDYGMEELVDDSDER